MEFSSLFPVSCQGKMDINGICVQLQHPFVIPRAVPRGNNFGFYSVIVDMILTTSMVY
jgi:hypothetical protein